jgi:hypothetical protein
MSNPIRNSHASKRAPENEESLVNALDGFVNLGDSLDEYKKFGSDYSKFFPLRVVDGFTPKNLAWDPACHLLALYYRDYLRALWRGQYRNGTLTVLLDLTPSFSFVAQLWLATTKGDLKLASLPATTQIPGFHDVKRASEALAAIRAAYPYASIEAPPGIQPDAATGTLKYEPANDFQAAVYILFRAIWKAKICPQCGRYFVAGKQAQLYCSVQCHASVNRERDRQFWKRKGNSLRKTRRAATKSRRKRGK